MPREGGGRADALEHRTGTFPGSGGLSLVWQSWRPVDRPPQAVVVAIHGLGDHSGLYAPAVEYLVPRGYAWYGFDLRGNGRSPGPRGHVQSWSEYREDLRAFLTLVSGAEPGRPRFLLGISLGGLIALDYALHHPEDLQGVVAVGAPLGPIGVPSWLMALAAIASRIWPTATWRTGLDLDDLSRDPAVVAGALTDPLFHRYATARLAAELTRTAREIRARAGELAVPLLLLHGGADRMVSPAGSRAYFAAVTQPDKELRVYAPMFHDLLHDPDRAQVLSDLQTWLDRHRR